MADSNSTETRARGAARIINDNKPARYFFQMANIADDIGLSVYAFRLYSRLVRISSLRAANVSTRALSNACKMSMGSISNAKAELVKAGLISIVKKPSGRGEDYDEIHILDITARNVAHCEALRLSSSGELIAGHSSSGELTSSSGERDSSSHERISSSGEHKGKPLQQPDKTEGETEEESGASAPPAPAPDSPANPSSSSSVTVTETRSGASVITLQTPENNNAGGSGKGKRKREPKFSPANITEHEDTRVNLYLEYLRPEITRSNAALILERVSGDYPDAWEAAISDMATGKGRGKSYNPDDFSLLFDLYDARVRAIKAAALAAKHANKREAQPVNPLRERLAQRFAGRFE